MEVGCGKERVLVVWEDGSLTITCHLARKSLHGRQLLVDICCEEIEAALQATRVDYIQLLACPSCLERGVDQPQLLDLSECVELLSTKVPTFTCETERKSVELSLLFGSDLALTHEVFLQRGGIFSGSELKLNDAPIARGSFGEVYQGTWRGLNVAAKRLFVHGDVGKEAVIKAFIRSRREVSFLRRLGDHPCIVKFVGLALNPFDIVMEWCEMDMHKACQRKLFSTSGGSLATSSSLEVCSAMAYLHDQVPPIAHRDLRSANVLLKRTGSSWVAQLADFGLATAVSAPLRGMNDAWPWMAPEVISGSYYTHECDVYSFGVLLWEIQAEDTPFMAELEVDRFPGVVKEKIQDEQAPLRPVIPPNAPPWLKAMIDACWKPDPKQRPSFRALRQDLMRRM
jgi:hypothetical protein